MTNHNVITIRKNLSFTNIKIDISMIGNDLSITVQGGTAPHIGCVAVASPRPSLTGNGSVSCTASVINIIGHKDELICRRIAESFACRCSKLVVCSGGIHYDNITGAQINEISEAVDDICRNTIL